MDSNMGKIVFKGRKLVKKKAPWKSNPDPNIYWRNRKSRLVKATTKLS